MTNEIIIAKIPGKKDCFDSSLGIPEFLTTNISISDGIVSGSCIDGKSKTPVEWTAPVGAIIAYEVDEDNVTKTGWNCWKLGEDYVEEKLDLIDGEYYAKPVPLRAQVVSSELPAFTEGMEIIFEDDGSFSFDPGWGDGTMLNAVPGEGVWICYGSKKDGSPDVNYCKFGTKSSANYVILSEDGSRTPLDSLA